MIPENKLGDIKTALKSTFGVTAFDDIVQLTTGLSNALVFRIRVQGTYYVLKIARTDNLSDPTLYYYSCMKPAAEAGIAPKVWYAGVEDGISIVDYVDLKPFPIADARIKMADVLSRLHSLPLFSKTIHSLDTINRFAGRFRDAKILPEDMTSGLFKSLERITAVYFKYKEELVPSHNDLKPENILYDGNTAWLSDWEAAFNNDEYSDLSIVANFICTNESDENEFLKRYFKRNASDYELSRFYLMRQIMHLSYFIVFMIFVARNGKPIDINSIKIHDFRDFHNRMWEGKIDLSPDEYKLEYAMVHLEQFRFNTGSVRFEDALRIVSGSKK